MFTRRLFLSKATLPSTSANNVQSRPVPTLLPAKNLVPRWRTMMLPAVTNSPPKHFTPNRLLTLSRPLRTLPCPFLCAIHLCLDLRDFDPGQFLPVSYGAMVAFPALHLEGDFLLAPEVLDNVGHDRSFRKCGRTHRDFAF